MDEAQELEWAVREYTVATEHLIEVLSKHEEVSSRVGAELIALATALTEEWG
jgi:hypothetical protein